MRIIYLSNSVIPSRTANSVHVMKMCQAFSDMGKEVILIARNGGNGEAEAPGFYLDEVYQSYGVNNTFRLMRMDIRVLNKKVGFYLYSMMSALRVISLRPDVVYCRNFISAYLVSSFGYKTIYESHAPVFSSSWPRVTAALLKRMIVRKNFYRFVVITNSLREYYLINYPVLVSKIQVAPDGADVLVEDEAVLSPLNPEGEVSVGYIGHLYRGKGMEVISQLAEACPWARFHVIGGEDTEIECWREKCNGLDNLIFHGYVEHGEAIRYLKGFDIVLLPNQRVVEAAGGGGDIGMWTSPLKAFEYMAAGKAIIASNIPVLREFLEHERNCLLCDPENIVEWSQALRRLVEDEDLRKRLGSEARDDLEKKYSWGVRASSILQDQ